MKRKFSIVMVCLLCACASASFARGNAGLSSIVSAPSGGSYNQLTQGGKIQTRHVGCYSFCADERFECRFGRPPAGDSDGVGEGGEGGGDRSQICQERFYECLRARCIF